MIDLKKIKVTSERRVYKIKYSDKDFVIKTPKFIIPFGHEKYNGKIIVNLEFDTINTDANEYISMIKSIEEIFSRICTECSIDVHPRLKVDIDGYQFITSIKDRSICNNKIFHHRCHIKDGTSYPRSETQVKSMEATIKLDHLWIHNGSYGLMWYITDMKVID